jgi:hypothetical protein
MMDWKPWVRAKEIVEALPLDVRMRMKDDYIVVTEDGEVKAIDPDEQDEAKQGASVGLWVGKMWPPEGKCANCFIRPGTLPWDNGVGWIAATHGMASLWCKRCVLEAQLENARALATAIPELEKALAEVDDAN